MHYSLPKAEEISGQCDGDKNQVRQTSALYPELLRLTARVPCSSLFANSVTWMSSSFEGYARDMAISSLSSHAERQSRFRPSYIHDDDEGESGADLKSKDRGVLR